jgi:predicted ester cyclase
LLPELRSGVLGTGSLIERSLIERSLIERSLAGTVRIKYGGSAMSLEENKAIVRQFFEAFQANDQVALKELLAPDLAAYLPGSPDPLNREAHLEVVRRWNMAFSGLHFTIENQIAEGDLVATRTILRGVHDRGDFLNLSPTGKQIAISIFTMERIRDGKIVERRVNLDLLDLMQQLGVPLTRV